MSHGNVILHDDRTAEWTQTVDSATTSGQNEAGDFYDRYSIWELNHRDGNGTKATLMVRDGVGWDKEMGETAGRTAVYSMDDGGVAVTVTMRAAAFEGERNLDEARFVVDTTDLHRQATDLLERARRHNESMDGRYDAWMTGITREITLGRYTLIVDERARFARPPERPGILDLMGRRRWMAARKAEAQASTVTIRDRDATSATAVERPEGRERRNSRKHARR